MPTTEGTMRKTNEELMQKLKQREAQNAEEKPVQTLPGSTAGRSVAQRLERKFGVGTDEVRRRGLYARLEREVEIYGDAVYRIISDVVAGAAGKRSEARWFCRTVILRLKENGYLIEGDNADW